MYIFVPLFLSLFHSSKTSYTFFLTFDRSDIPSRVVVSLPMSDHVNGWVETKARNVDPHWGIYRCLSGITSPTAGMLCRGREREGCASNNRCLFVVFEYPFRWFFETNPPPLLATSLSQWTSSGSTSRNGTVQNPIFFFSLLYFESGCAIVFFFCFFGSTARVLYSRTIH